VGQFSAHDNGAHLVCIDGPGVGAVLPVLAEPVVIGAADSCDLSLNDARVSRRHAQATFTGSAVEILDLDSKNGCYHQGKRFERRELGFGSEFTVGKSTFKVLPAERDLHPEEAETSTFGQLIGDSADMRRLFTLIDQVAATDVSVLIEGETGVGKELVAEEIHRRSSRKDKPFVVFDCGAIPSELIESALFGHVRGAFTGATADRGGLFDEANGGTVFLDEVGELKLDLQPSLLRVLDRGMVRSVGESRFRSVDVRVVAATHRRLTEMVDEQRFREDLYYRLAVVRLGVPALRDRCEDIPLLARHFLRRTGRPDLSLTEDQLQTLAEHAWPGNVRELRNMVERGVALAQHGVIAIGGTGDAKGTNGEAGTGRETLRDFGKAPRLKFTDAKAVVVENFEREYLIDLMAEFDSLTQAAKAAGMDRKHLRLLLERHGITT